MFDLIFNLIFTEPPPLHLRFLGAEDSGRGVLRHHEELPEELPQLLLGEDPVDGARSHLVFQRLRESAAGASAKGFFQDNFRGLVLGCIEAKFCKNICV